MTENEKINGWTFEETVKTAENLMKAESNMFKWDVLRHLRDFAEAYKDKVQQFEAIGTIERFRELTEKAEPKKPLNIRPNDTLSAIFDCPSCGRTQKIQYQGFHCKECGQNLDWE